MGTLAVRLDVASESSPVRLALRPAVGLNFQHTTGGTGGSSYVGLVAPSLAAMLIVRDNLYLAPQVGFAKIFSDDATDSDSSYRAIGFAIGGVTKQKPFAYSFELSVQRLTAKDSMSEQTLYFVTPTLGITLSAD